MDPITVVGAISAAASVAQTAWNVGETLYSFFQSTKAVNKTVRDLANSLKAFGDTCDLVHSSLQTLEAAYGSNQGLFRSIRFGDDQLLWRGVQRRLEECQHIIDELGAAISNVNKEQSGFFAQAWRQYKLDLKKEDIGSIQNRLQHHSTALGLTLQAIKIRVDHLIPRHADNVLLRELQDLRKLLQRNQSTADQTEIANDLVKFAQNVLNSGAILYKSSVDDGSIADVSEIFTLTDDLDPTGSSWIEQWSADVPIMSSAQGLRDMEPPARSVLPGKAPVLAGVASSDDEQTLFRNNGDELDDSDDDFDLQIVQQTILEGSSAFDEGKFEEAYSILSDALQQMSQIPARRRSECGFFNVQHKLAVCAYHLRGPEEASKILVAFVQIHPETDADRSLLCNAGHLLAQVYVRMDKLETARATCDSALRGRRRLLGQQHQEYYDSMALMARIMELQGNSIRSNTLMRQIPDDQRHRLTSQFAELTQISEPGPSSTVLNTEETESRVGSRQMPQNEENPVATTGSSAQFLSRIVGRPKPNSHGISPAVKKKPVPVNKFQAEPHAPISLEPKDAFRADVVVGIDFGMGRSCKLSALPHALILRSRKSKNLIVHLTTGVAWSYGPEWPEAIVIRHWPGKLGHELAPRVRSSVDCDTRSGNLVSWGFLCTPEDDRLTHHELFKLNIDPSYIDPYQGSLTSKEAQMWYKNYLSCLYQYIMQHFQATIPQFSSKRIQFLFSIPTSWRTNSALVAQVEHCIRSAGYGQNARERACASFTEAEATAILALGPYVREGDVLLICNADDWTTDVNIIRVEAALHKQSDLRPLSWTEGAPIGSMIVDWTMRKSFIKAVNFLIEWGQHIERVKSIRHLINEGGMDKMVDDAFPPSRCSPTFGNLPLSFDATAPKIFLPIPGLESGVNFPQAGIEDSSVTWTREYLRGISDNLIDKLINLINTQVRVLEQRYPQEQISYILLTGSFGGYDYVQSRIEAYFQTKSKGTAVDRNRPEIVTVDEPETAIARGLVGNYIQDKHGRLPMSSKE